MRRALQTSFARMATGGYFGTPVEPRSARVISDADVDRIAEAVVAKMDARRSVLDVTPGDVRRWTR